MDERIHVYGSGVHGLPVASPCCALGLTARGAFAIYTVNICKKRFTFWKVTGKLQASELQVFTSSLARIYGKEFEVF